MSMITRTFSRAKSQFATAKDAYKDIRKGARLGAASNYRIVEEHNENEWVFQITRE